MIYNIKKEKEIQEHWHKIISLKQNKSHSDNSDPLLSRIIF